MAEIFEASVQDIDFVKSREIAVIGYGNQGRAHALDLRDQNFRVNVGARPSGRGFKDASDDGFNVLEIAEAAASCELLMLTLPDIEMPEIYDSSIAPSLQPGQTLLFCHGFNIFFKRILCPEGLDVVLVSPKGSGHSLRNAFTSGHTLPALIAVEQDVSGKARSIASGYGAGIGCGEFQMMTTFREETVTDLFGEQVVLCGGLIELLKNAFSTLVDRGYQPEAAYFECVHEAKLIVDLLMDRGLTGMRQAISDTAEWGGYLVGPQIVGDVARSEMAKALDDIESGKFTEAWIEEAINRKKMSAFRDEESKGGVEAMWQSVSPRMRQL